jgi:hypothetical protein
VDVAALLVSVVALVVAIGAAAYARQQARAADRQAKAAEEERHERRTPDVEVTTEWIDSGNLNDVHVIFRLASGSDLADVLAEIIHSDDPSGRPRTVPFPSWGGEQWGTTVRSLGPFKLGEVKRFRANRNPSPDEETTHLRLTCQASNGETWTYVREAKPPHAPPMAAWV